jgi:uroporphyrin-III C-methyltransferase/precorrin-2 dehydrogenase/sirohydrochlorin ferrochelatase
MSDRKPIDSRPPRMDRLARLPVFFALAGKRAVIAGGGAAAAWKAELLSAAGAHVDVYASVCTDDMRIIAADPPQGPILIHDREWTKTDFADAAIAVGEFGDDTAACCFAEAARTAGVAVNVIDKPQFCDFAFGAIVNRSPLVIGISTDGAAPVFGQAIRAKIEALIPFGFKHWAQAALRLRPAVQARKLPFRARRGFWERFTDRAVAAPDQAPNDADLLALLAQADHQTIGHAGRVMLVGAGPGDPELLTLRAVRALQSADVILFDELVGPGVLDFARREAKKMLVGKTGYGPSCKQDDINALMVSLAKAGRRVVRLKGGDPMIFGRANEEIAACRAACIAVEVIPGITSAQAAASRLGVSLTSRGEARRLQFITGHDRGGKLPGDIDWTSIADPSVTTVVYMPKKTLAELATTAIARGLDPTTPAIAMANISRPEEAMISGPIADLAEKLESAAPSGPVLVLIGRAMAQAQQAAISEPKAKSA